ncbi:hypothetical protein [Streptomyces erythrochromogenes]|uniref:hypothetical protein n=1 Tax=Streptomyces erythrochromogenes TaxID=285574 RepID=UPI002F90F57F|nr:hypothetical protein OG489_40205 [Streptomyces erythrochromogenes]WSR88917.1 hypothetical protein OG489_40055 [Streptomyces erythrochromogenes]
MTESKEARSKALETYGPHQFPERIGFELWRFERALAKGLIPPEDVGGRRWSAAVVEEAEGRAAEIRAATDGLPDMGACRAAAVLEERFEVKVAPEVLAELDRVGLIECVGEYKGHPLYDGQALADFADRTALEKAKHNGRLLNRTAGARYLGIRASDFDHLTNAKWLRPTTWVHSGWQRRRDVPCVALYRLGDLDVLLEHPAIDWDEIRATPKGRPSPLARLTSRKAAKV